MAKNLVRNLDYRQHEFNIDSIVTAIEEGYLTYNETRERTKETFSPSALVYGHGRCPRYWFYAFSGAEFEQDNDPQSIANMKNGIAAHARLGEVLGRSSLNIKDLEAEVHNEDPPIFGYLDVLVEIDGEDAVGEIKTARQEAFIPRQAKMKGPNYHLLQILIYMKIMQTSYGFLLYENKNTHELLVIPVAYKDYEVEVEETFQWMRDVRKAWEDGKLSSRPFRSNARECKTCPVRSTCFGQPKKGEIDIEPLRVLR